nr:peptidylprolyl isomerase [Pseudomonas asuensis]
MRASGAEPMVIASSEQEWPRVRVNGVAITPEAIAEELQYHPAPSRETAIYQTVQALVMREILRQRVVEQGLAGTGTKAVAEEAAICQLLERDVKSPDADEETCLRYYTSHQARFSSAPLIAASHILLACAPDDVDTRSQARVQALEMIEQLSRFPDQFGELAQRYSACPSSAQGGSLGQLSQGQTVPEFERVLFRLPKRLSKQPLESRYGVHVVHVDERLEGSMLPYEVVKNTIKDQLNQQAWHIALAHHLRILVGQALIEGIRFDGIDSPLLQ